MSDFGIGNVVKIENYSGLYVVVSVKRREDLGSMSYDRDYFVVPLTVVKEGGILKELDFEKVSVSGIDMTPKITKVETEVPYRVQKEVTYRLLPMKPKVVYE